MRTLFRLLLAFALLAPAAALAAPGERTAAAALGPADHKDLERIEDYLNGIRTLKSGFLQVSSDGGTARGTVWLARPGRLRFEYDPPVPVRIVADGVWLIYVDTELEQTSHIPLGSTPLGFLVAETVRLGGSVRVEGIERGSNVLRVIVSKADEPELGRVVMTFSDKPLELRQWTVIDAKGVETRVSLLDPAEGVKVDPRLFHVDPPRRRVDP